MVYNVHSLVHFAKEVLENRPVDKFSAYPFENCLKTIKSCISANSKPLEQLYNRDAEKSQIHKIRCLKQQIKISVSRMRSPRDLREEEIDGAQFERLNLGEFELKAGDRSNGTCLMRDGSVVVVDNIIKTRRNINVAGKKFLKASDFYTYPVPSSVLGILEVSDLQYLSIGSIGKCLI